MTRLPFAAVLLSAAAAAADDAAARKFLRDLEGTYTIAAMTRGGEVAPQDEFKAATVTVKGETLTASFKKGDDREDKAATLVVDPGQRPVAIDMTPKDGPDAGKPVLGIVKVEGDTVTVCWGDRQGTPVRPKEFASTKANGHLLMVLKKAR